MDPVAQGRQGAAGRRSIGRVQDEQADFITGPLDDAPSVSLRLRSPCQGESPVPLREAQNPPNSLNVLREAEGGHRGELADTAIPEPAVERLAGVLDEKDAVPPACLVQDIHRIGNPVQVRGHHRLQARPGALIHFRGIQVARCGVERTHHRHQACRQDREEDHVVVDRRDQDAIPWSQPLAESEVESETTRRDVQRLPVITPAEELLDSARGARHGAVSSEPAASSRAFRACRRILHRSRASTSRSGRCSRTHNFASRSFAVQR